MGRLCHEHFRISPMYMFQLKTFKLFALYAYNKITKFVQSCINEVLFCFRIHSVHTEIAQNNTASSSKFSVRLQKYVIMFSMSVTVKAFSKLDLVCRKRAVSNSRPACRQAFLNFIALLFYLRQ